jgi:hypothetical protein
MLFKKLLQLCLMAHTYNPDIQKAEAGRSQVPGQSELHSKTLPQKKKNFFFFLQYCGVELRALLLGQAPVHYTDYS